MPGEWKSETLEACIKRLRDSAAGLLEAVLEADQNHPRTRLTHPYFGRMRLDQVIDFISVHTRHHCKQLEEAGALGDGSDT